MKPTTLQDAIDRIAANTQTTADVEYVLAAYTPWIDKYTAILHGKFISSAGHKFLNDDNVRIFAYSFKRGGNVYGTLQWVVQQCKRYSDALHAEVISSFLECLRTKGRTSAFPSVLAKNISELIGSPLEVLMDDLERVPMRAARTSASSNDFITKAEKMFSERGIVLTPKERQLVNVLSEKFDFGYAAREMGISRQGISSLLKRLKRKAELTYKP